MPLLHSFGPGAGVRRDPGQVLAWLVLLLVLLLAPLQCQAAPHAEPAAQSTTAADIRQRLQHGSTLAEQQQVDQAIEVFRRLTQDHPDLTEAYNNLAVLQARQGRYAEARSNFEKALRTSRSHATAYDNLVQMYALQASQAYARALQQRPAAPDATRFMMLQEISPMPRTQAPPPEAGPVQPAPAAATAMANPVEAGPSAPAAAGMSIGTLISLIGLFTVCLALLFVTLQSRAAARSSGSSKDSTSATASPRSAAAPGPAAPEARLIEIYRLIGAGNSREALAKAETLVNEVPNFQLAQLVYGDLLMSQSAPIEGFGSAAATSGSPGAAMVGQLQQEAQKRLHALTTKPPAGTVPRAFLLLAGTVRHAIAIDTSHSRLYLFENRASGPVQIASYYVALGRLGVGKSVESDLRTPLGIYFVTGRLDTRELDDFYGAGALPLNYPNEHDRLHGRTGSDIWLHGVPSDQYARPPSSTNGCIVLANDDLRRLWRDLAPVHTPVVITRGIDWVDPHSLASLRKELLDALEGWRQARSLGDLQRTLGYYAADYRVRDTNAPESRRAVERELLSSGPREREIKDASLLAWTEEGERVVISFTEHVRGNRAGTGRRQYWSRESGQWKIYSEGTVE
ncbi:MAG: hypothetical protein RLY71_3365 [Pseudomonadota bacterium]|jgi:tetratricopeptide (TPR) repeat protein